METLTADGSPTSDSVELRTAYVAAMRKLAATITLVTTCEDGKPHGMAATAVCSLSADPPAVLACVNRTASLHGPVTRVKWFCINLLGQQHAQLFQEFTRRQGQARFEVGEWNRGPHHLPSLADAVATLVCSVEQQVDFGTHTVFIGMVVSAKTVLEQAPLIYQDANVGQFSPSPKAPSSVSALRLGNVIYEVSDLDRAIAFYRDILGLRLKLTDSARWAAFDVGGATLALEQAAPVRADHAPRASLKLTGNLPQFLAQLEAAGTKVGALKSGDHEQTAVICDPDGNEITLYVPRTAPQV